MKTKELIVPSGLGDVRLSQWQEILLKGEDITEESLVGILCDITPQQVLELPNNIYTQAVAIISLLLPKVGNEHKLKMRFEMDGVEYGMIPNLDNISYGENKDIVAFLSDWKDMHLAMTVLFRPITKKADDTYAIEKYDGKLAHKDKMLNMPLDVVLGAQVFFYNLANELLKHTLDSLAEDQSLPLTVRQALATSGDGIIQFMHLLEGHSLESKKLQSEDYTNV